MKKEVSNVLAQRYASAEMCDIWSAEGKVGLERDFWIAIMKAQRSLGISIPEEAIEAYEAVRNNINLDSIMERERVTRHDVKARIEEFCDLAGHEHVHKGMTSRDLTENVEQLQIYKSLILIRKKAVAALICLERRMTEFEGLLLTGRTHNVAAQSITFGKRLANYAEEMIRAIERLNELVETYPFRGLKGAVGTQQDQLSLFDGDAKQVLDLEQKVLGFLEVPRCFQSVGQVYPRSLDFEAVSVLYQLGSAPSNFAKTLRLMAGHDLASEGFAKGQVGSSAMPHKMNSRSCERLNGFQTILSGYVTMCTGLAGDQWNEGDVSCSVVRRVALPDSFMTIDSLLDTFITILNQMGAFPAVVSKEREHYLPFLLSTAVLMEAVKKGVGREAAHEAIKEHAVATALDLRNGAVDGNNLWDRLASDDRFDLSREELDQIVQEKSEKAGLAEEQVQLLSKRVTEWQSRFPEMSDYEPSALL